MKHKVLFLESFYGGSHRDFADGMVEHSKHTIDLSTLPARFWKWRMRGAAFSFIKAVPDPREYDCVFATDLMGIADLKALWGSRCPPIILYFHENQLSYPVPEGQRIDYQFGFTNISSALAADVIVFNSSFHQESFFSALPGFLRSMPDHEPMWVIDTLKAKAEIIYPGCRFPAEASDPGPRDADLPLVVWNHRWEFDKDPEGFFLVLDTIDDSGIEFELALLGENFQKVPKPFLAARERYGKRIKVYGYVDNRADYYRWLSIGDVVVSTAIQENYGISIIEAIRMGCIPVLPTRLSYPEILPPQFHHDCLYSNKDELVSLLSRRLSVAPDAATRSLRNDLIESMGRYSWDNLAGSYDALIDKTVGQAGK